MTAPPQNERLSFLQQNYSTVYITVRSDINETDGNAQTNLTLG